jgi:hypothetical protein
MEFLNNNNKYDALKLRFTDQVSLLLKMSEIDLKIFSGYITLQLALGAWLITKKDLLPPDDDQRIVSLIGLFVLDVVLAGIASKFLYNNYKRRAEVVSTLKNLNKALGFSDPCVYIDTAINSETKFRPWWYWYLVGIISGVIGIGLVMYGIA